MAEEKRMPKVGEPVVYVNPVGLAHPALVTAAWGPTCINLVHVSSDAQKGDTYGRQTERQTSCSHASVVPVWGNYWRFADEAPKETEKQQ